MAFVAVDLVGGLVAFQLRPTREQYGRTSLGSRLTFALVHVQPFAVPLAGQGSWRRAAVRYVATVGSTAALELLPVRAASRRGVANTLGAALSAVDLASDGSPQRWFGPVYLMKVIGGHGGIPGSAPLRRGSRSFCRARTALTTSGPRPGYVRGENQRPAACCNGFTE